MGSGSSRQVLGRRWLLVVGSVAVCGLAAIVTTGAVLTASHAQESAKASAKQAYIAELQRRNASRLANSPRVPAALKDVPTGINAIASVMPDGELVWASCAEHSNAACGVPPYPANGYSFTNYALSPSDTIIAGTQKSTGRGVIISTDGPDAGVHLLPAGAGTPTIVHWGPSNIVTFSTSTGLSGTFHGTTGQLTTQS